MSDIVVTSVPPGQTRPVTSECLKPGSFFIPLDLTNSWQSDVLGATDRFVADNPKHMTDLLVRAYPETGGTVRNITSLQDVVAGRADKADPCDRTFVGVCGIASTDVVIGWEIYRRAVEADAGTIFHMT